MLPNGDITLSCDGVMRFINTLICALIQDEDAFRPQVRMLTNEQRTGSVCDTVATRVDGLVNF